MPEQRGSRLGMVLGIAGLLVLGVASAAAESPVAGWKRWTPDHVTSAGTYSDGASTLRAVDFSFAVEARPGAMERLVAKWANGAAPLPWTETALDLVVKYQQNPLRAARVLAHLHAAANDALIELAPTSTDPAAQAVAVHATASTVLTHFYPEESPGRLGAMGRGAALSAVAKAKSSGVSIDDAWRVGERAAARTISRALNDGADAIWNPAHRPKPGPGIWRAVPPLSLFNPTEPLAGTWKTWALADSGEIQPPPPVPYGSERYWKEAQEVLRKLAKII